MLSSHVSRSIKSFLIYAILLLPLLYTSTTMFPAHFGKVLVFGILVDVIFIISIYKNWHKELIVQWTRLDIFMLLFFVFLGVSSLVGVDPLRSFFGYQSRGMGFFSVFHYFLLYMLLRQHSLHKKEWNRLLYVVIGVGCISALIAWVGPYIPWFSSIVRSERQLSGFVTNPIFFAAYLIFPVFISLFFVIRSIASKNNRLLFSMLLVSIFLLITVMFTRVRGAYVGLFIASGFTCILAIYWIITKAKKNKAYFFWGLMAAVCFLIILWSSPHLRTLYIEPVLEHTLYTDTAQTRLMAWKVAYYGFLQHPWFGWGSENYQYVFDSYYNPQFIIYSLRETLWDKPHNHILELFVTGGIFVGLSYVGIILMLVVGLVKIIVKNNNRIDYSSLIILWGLLWYVVQNMFGIETFYSYHLFFLICAFLVGYLVEHDVLHAHTISIKNVLTKKVIMAVVAILFTSSIIVQYRLYHASQLVSQAKDYQELGDIKMWLASADTVLQYKVPFNWEQAQFLVQDLSAFDTKNLLTNDVVLHVGPALANVFTESLMRSPDALLNRIYLADLYVFMAEYATDANLKATYEQQSIDQLKAALQISPGNQRVLLSLAKSYLLQKNFVEAEAIFQQLFTSEIDVPEYHWFYGLALMEAGREDDAINELQKGFTFGLTFESNVDYVANIFIQRKEYTKIVEMYQFLISMDPENALWYARLAAAFAEVGDKERMIDAINRAVQIDTTLQEESQLFLQQQGIIL